MLELGQNAKDKITGFEGILTARHQYITGCDQYSLSPVGLDKENKLKEIFSFDEGRVEILGPGVNPEEIKAEKPGGPQFSSTSVR
jgi:hypothetical protein